LLTAYDVRIVFPAKPPYRLRELLRDHFPLRWTGEAWEGEIRGKGEVETLRRLVEPYGADLTTLEV
jgi:hypothetical protein